MKKIKYLFLVIFSIVNIYSQSDFTSQTKFNIDAGNNRSQNESEMINDNSSNNIPSNLLNGYNTAAETGNQDLKNYYGNKIENYLSKPQVNNTDNDIKVVPGTGFEGDWYNGDVLVTNTEVAYTGSYRQIDMKQGEDGNMYLAVNRRNAGGLNGSITVYTSTNGGSSWNLVSSVFSAGLYFGSVAMLVESRNNSVGDSTRIILFFTVSGNSNFNDANLYCSTFRRDGSAPQTTIVASPSAGNRFVYPSACSDGMFNSSATYMHAVVREETNAGTNVKLHHFRTINWGVSFTSAEIITGNDDRYPVCAFSNETGTDSIYIAVERVIAANEHEIRILATSEIPTSAVSYKYITTAAPGDIYERPCMTIQQRHYSLPQRIFVTCTKNNKAVYHYSVDGGAVWTVDAGLGLNSQNVDYTYCSSDSLIAGGKDFIASFVDQNGDSVSVRHGTLGAMGILNHKMNSVQSTGALVPPCAIYKQGSNKYAAFTYSGLGPANVYYDMETFLTAIDPVSNEVPNSFSLLQNYPNPFNPETNIKFTLPKDGNVTLKVFDVSGRVVAEIVNGNLNAGTYSVSFNASKLSSGVYFYRISADGFTDTKKMILVK